ncbi:COG5377 Phage-related protein, predicted endonuclease [uncultured Caudovirales phage]|uniref:COG5377 Phage-related protein, predicted endonuclease n=1 Tax=uncultured Caudovirales phage TaxID=2100421 RepID=A0A6J5LLG6_9CAUD|nr:COG5377 Phage-related protein, predicted endonuclease [uncultured Caudovirales phage]
MSAAIEIVALEQGSPEWLDFRRDKVTATDANYIMGASHWKTKIQLYKEKKDPNYKSETNERMQRGIDLEPIARALFCAKTGHKMVPKVVVKDWAMASLDGINDWNEILEIKCPGDKDHQIALNGKVPDHYYPQLQHQMWVCDSEKAFYFSFDGFDGVIVEVKRDEAYIEKMILEEFKFYMCLRENTPPEPEESDYIQRDDDLWGQCVSQWHTVHAAIKELEKEEEELKNQLIFLSGESNSRGAGISLCKVVRKGAIDYAKVPILKTIDLEPYRKPSITSWRITAA